MLNFEKPKKELGKFLRDGKDSFAKKKLMKIGLATGAAIIGMNFLFDSAVLAQHNNVDDVTMVSQRVTGTFCFRIFPSHANHNQHSNHSSHSSY